MLICTFPGRMRRSLFCVAALYGGGLGCLPACRFLPLCFPLSHRLLGGRQGDRMKGHRVLNLRELFPTTRMGLAQRATCV